MLTFCSEKKPDMVWIAEFVEFVEFVEIIEIGCRFWLPRVRLLSNFFGLSVEGRVLSA